MAEGSVALQGEMGSVAAAGRNLSSLDSLNQAMVDAHDPSVPSSRVVAVVAFSGGEGTADMVRRARAAGLPVWEVSA